LALRDVDTRAWKREESSMVLLGKSQQPRLPRATLGERRGAAAAPARRVREKKKPERRVPLGPV
jgi:hypothetical protein